MIRYFKVPVTEVTQEMAEISHCSSPEYLRQNKDYAIVMVAGSIPDILKHYEQINIKEELLKAEWNTKEEL